MRLFTTQTPLPLSDLCSGYTYMSAGRFLGQKSQRFRYFELEIFTGDIIRGAVHRELDNFSEQFLGTHLKAFTALSSAR